MELGSLRELASICPRIDIHEDLKIRENISCDKML